MADEADIVGERDAFVTARHCLDRLVVGRDPGADQAIGDGQAVDDVDGDVLGFLQGFGGIVAGRTRTDDRDMTHSAHSFGVSAWVSGPLVLLCGDASGDLRQGKGQRSTGRNGLDSGHAES
eukprot:TRINITY_DN37256_c0_g1_i1.p1 TRINITY_DN37256_c0_g1~~TRINITY_DN37256_c0_g1_i1.p1  ORF type:complete len:134 (+),score=20.27 TRINITY_DN37256_c0_g1_i1:40-402(+)